MTMAGWLIRGTRRCGRSWTGRRSARWPSGTGCRGSRCTRGRPGTRRQGWTGCGRPRSGRGPRRRGWRRRPRRWSASCGRRIRGGVPGGSCSRWHNGAQPTRRRGRRCTGSWSATRWSRRRPRSAPGSTPITTPGRTRRSAWRHPPAFSGPASPRQDQSWPGQSAEPTPQPRPPAPVLSAPSAGGRVRDRRLARRGAQPCFPGPAAQAGPEPAGHLAARVGPTRPPST